MTVAEIILEQLGGNKFVVMTGAKNFVKTDNSLKFFLPRRAGSKVNLVTITLDNDLYILETYLFNFRTLSLTKQHRVEHVFVENLKNVFEENTGLRCSL